MHDDRHGQDEIPAIPRISHSGSGHTDHVSERDFVETVTVVAEAVRAIGVRFEKVDGRVTRLQAAIVVLAALNLLLLLLLVLT